MALPNQYYLIDDYGTSAGPSGGGTGSGSGTPVSPEFTAPSITAAAQVGFLIASALQRPVRLVAKFGTFSAPPYTLITGQAANVSLTSVPSGIGY